MFCFLFFYLCLFLLLVMPIYLFLLVYATFELWFVKNVEITIVF
jgi:hypothetical protein